MLAGATLVLFFFTLAVIRDGKKARIGTITFHRPYPKDDITLKVSWWWVLIPLWLCLGAQAHDMFPWLP